MNSKNLIEDPRTIYSLAMVLILYEVYKSDFLISGNILFNIIKIGLLILIATQLIFLYLCGLSYAGFKDIYMENLKGIANYLYTLGFQISLPIFVLGISFIFISYLFNSFLLTLWGKILLLIINCIIDIGMIMIYKKCFKRTEGVMGYLIYSIIVIWLIIIILGILYSPTH